MYIRMSAKNSELSIVGLELNCTADYALAVSFITLSIYSAESFTYPTYVYPASRFERRLKCNS